MSTTDKDILRKIFLKKRKGLPHPEVIKKSHDIYQKIIVFDEVKKTKNVSIYIPINNEVETKAIIDDLVNMGINIFVPKYSKNGNNYFLSRFTNWQNLQVGPHRIQEPQDDIRVDPSLVNVAILPGLAFSKRGVRLGYGKGVFDRLFAKSKAVRIGLGYDFQIIEEIPKEEHDLVMDLIITEKRIIRS